MNRTASEMLSGPFSINRDTAILETGPTSRQLSTTQNITSGSGYTKLALVLSITIGSGLYNTSTEKFIAPITGAYHLIVDGEVDSVPVAGNHTIQIKKNGTTIDSITSNFVSNLSGGSVKKVSINISRFYQLAANDEIEIFSGDNVSIADETMVSFNKI